LLAVCIVAYALIPIDLITDLIPVLGYLDDLILVPLGIYFVLRMIPDEVIIECRERVKVFANHKRSNLFAGLVIITIWIGLAILAARLMMRAINNRCRLSVVV
jgi:hypothetical protein